MPRTTPPPMDRNTAAVLIVSIVAVTALCLLGDPVGTFLLVWGSLDHSVRTAALGALGAALLGLLGLIRHEIRKHTEPPRRPPEPPPSEDSR